MAFYPLVRQSRKPYRRDPGAGELRVSTITSPLTYNAINNKVIGLDYELAQHFADYLGVKLKVTVRQNISQLFDDLDNGDADLLAAGLVYNSERSKNYQPGPTYYSVSQQLVYRVGSLRPRTLANLTAEQLVIAPGHVAIEDLRVLKEKNILTLAGRSMKSWARRPCWNRLKTGSCPIPSPTRLPSASSSVCILNWPWRWT